MRLLDNGATAEYAPTEQVPAPAYDTTDVVVAAPPEVGPPTQANQLIRFLPIVTAIATVAAMAVAYHSRSAAARNPVFLMFPLIMLASAMATVFSNVDRRRGEINAKRAEYLGYLSDVRAAAIKTAAAQHYSLLWRHPDPDTLWTLTGGCRMWERRAADSDFCQVRIGVGTLPLATRLIAPTMDSVGRQDPVAVNALRGFLRMHSTVPDAPIPIALRDLTAVSVGGDLARARALLRATICQLAVMHSPRLVLIAAAVSDHNRNHWDWLKWLPHNRHPAVDDDIGPARMVYVSVAAAMEALAGVLADRLLTDPPVPHVLVVVDGPVGEGEWVNSVGGKGITILTVNDSASVGALRVSADQVLGRTPNGDDVVARPDAMSYAAALACAHRLAGYRADGMNTSKRTGWQDLIGIGDVDSFAPEKYWSAKSRRDRLRVPIGTAVGGAPVELDIKEAAENGMGPHGLCIGATGSGKSEFLRTIALGMIACHSPEQLNLVLVDFKGGATFAGLEHAPHVAAVITNLSDKAAMVTRMRDALTGEMNRRQEVLREAGNLDGIAAYQRARQAGVQLDSLPTLFIIVDEFSELLSKHPDFTEVFVAIGRLGRSLGVHLLLASQRLDEGRLRGLESHLSYRVCLKTLSSNESRSMLGTSDAYELPSMPGAAYLRVGADRLIRFQTAYVSGPCRTEAHRVADESVSPEQEQNSVPVRLFTTEPIGRIALTGRAEADVVECRTVLQAVVDRLSGYGPRAHEVWLPPLGATPLLSAVLGDGEPMPALTVPIGIIDRPFEQRRTPLIVDLSGAAGNVAVVGAPQSGKSTALRTLIAAMVATHDPSTVQFYCLDFGGGALTSLREWPHVGSVAGRSDPQLARRTIDWLDSLIRSREKLFREHGIESMVHYRRLKAKWAPVCDRFGDVFLVVDGWSSLNREFDSAETSVAALAAEGLTYGVHIVVSASRWAEIRPALRDQIGTRIELRLGDPSDSELDRRRAQEVPEGIPGRGLSHDALHMVIALPRRDGADWNGGLLCRRDGWVAPPIPLLPAQIDHHKVIERANPSDAGLLIGLEENELQTVAIDFAHQLHLLILGDSESGKTAALRTLCCELLRTTNAAQCQLFIVDMRRSLLGVVQPESGQLGGYLASAEAVGEIVPRIVEHLLRRMPPSNATPPQLRDRTWWSGPEIYVVIDDYDLVGTTCGNSLAPLVEVLPHARDLGLHLLIARRSGGAARAMFEPLLSGLRDAGCMTLLMSGNPDEGLTIGPVRASPMPPGRGTLITRRGSPQLIQVGWSPPP